MFLHAAVFLCMATVYTIRQFSAARPCGGIRGRTAPVFAPFCQGSLTLLLRSGHRSPSGNDAWRYLHSARPTHRRHETEIALEVRYPETLAALTHGLGHGVSPAFVIIFLNRVERLAFSKLPAPFRIDFGRSCSITNSVPLPPDCS
jgi:hypothetical protein